MIFRLTQAGDTIGFRLPEAKLPDLVTAIELGGADDAMPRLDFSGTPETDHELVTRWLKMRIKDTVRQRKRVAAAYSIPYDEGLTVDEP